MPGHPFVVEEDILGLGFSLGGLLDQPAVEQETLSRTNPAPALTSGVPRPDRLAVGRELPIFEASPHDLVLTGSDKGRGTRTLKRAAVLGGLHPRHPNCRDI